jgi:5'-deoxynucleotidase YfbR-like HD superfamily hydrolase
MSMQPWIQTYTGIAFDLMEPAAGQIDILDIGHALSQIGRFGGHTQEFYSVAQHSVLVSENVPRCDALQALLHDASEAYIGDMVRPLKHSGVMQPFLEAESRLTLAIARKFDLEYDLSPAVKLADNRALFTEQRDLMGRMPKPWKDPVPPFEQTVVPMPSRTAKSLFLNRFYRLAEERLLAHG